MSGKGEDFDDAYLPCARYMRAAAGAGVAFRKFHDADSTIKLDLASVIHGGKLFL